MAAEHEKCDLVIEHQAKIGGMEKGMSVLEVQAQTLFSKMDVAIEKINTTQNKIEKVQDSIENGIRADIKELCNLYKIQAEKIDDAREEAIRKAEEVKKESACAMKDVHERLAPLEDNSWIPAVMNMGIRKAFLYFIMLLFAMAMANTAFWGISKNYFFKEPPNQQHKILEATEHGK